MDKLYDLGNGYTIEHVPGKEYSKYFATYTVWENNMWFRKSFEQAMESISDCNICYWIKNNNKRIGGVLLEENYMNCLVLEPPNTQYSEIISRLKTVLISISEAKKPIIVGGAKPYEIELYKQNGFTENMSRKCMIRPTETIEGTLDERFESLVFTQEKFDELLAVYVDAYRHAHYDHDYTEDSIRKDLAYYVEHFSSNDLLNKSSSIIVDKVTNEVVAVCMVSLWEEWPNIYEIIVSPSYQGKGLARFMLSKAISSLKEAYPVVRLFVTMGNNAEHLYTNMGFVSGIVTTEMHLLV